MDRIKSIFISVYLTVMTAVFVFGIVQYFQYPASHQLILAALGFLPAGLIGSFFIFKRARTHALLPIPTLLLLTLFVAFFFFNQGSSLIHWLGAIISISGWFIYLFWYSRFKGRTSKLLQVGKQLPDFELVNEQGQTVSSHQLLGSPSILLFFRGNWCPLCMAQIQEIAQQYQEISKRGAQTVLISPQPQKHTANLASKFDVPFLFWRDEKLKVAKLLDLYHKNGTPLGMEVFGYQSDTIMPTVIITDKNNEVVFLDLTDNYRVRPEPETFIQVLDQLTN